jgi:NAD(P)-dependent dehydrogenase (short-subunit alcohol dehydrogenase family)
MRRSLRDSVVVITGASSGIGRAAALAFARRGATVVVAARRLRSLSVAESQMARQQQRAGYRSRLVSEVNRSRNGLHSLDTPSCMS